MKVAIMQPYFFPYAGYFRLFSVVDLFVIYDCVQFPRRGWVHRNRVLDGGKESWVTLPIKKCPRETLIRDLEFRHDAESWHDKLSTYYGLANQVSEVNDWDVFKPVGSVIDYLENTLMWTCKKLNIPFNTVRSSDISIDYSLKGQDRILAICESVLASEYINLSGGSELYNERTFFERGIQLSVLDDYKGSYESIFGRLRNSTIETISTEIERNINWKVN